MPPLVARWSQAMAHIPREAWDALALPQDSPFLEWDWLALLEETGSVAPATGWTPLHLTLWEGPDMVGAAPLYAKAHSDGEFVFDQPFAELSRRLGIRYYPKLLGMSPFSPTGHYRFLLAAGREAELTQALLAATDALLDGGQLSGSHYHYVDPALADALETHGHSRWVHASFLWENRGYRDFADFLDIFNRNQRRNIRKERQTLRDQGVEVALLQGPEISEELMAAMYANYVETNAKFGPWGCKYLSREFFLQLPARCGRRLALAVALRNGGVLATALFVHKDGRLYGRYWGGADLRYLHFEVCYYAPIQWAIAQGFLSFDPGIGGFHKVRRGFRAVPNFSMHRLGHPRLRAVMEAHMPGINAQQLAELEEMNAGRPLAG